MNDINWGGRVANSDATLTFEAAVSASPMITTPIVSVQLLEGYTSYHVAAVFAEAWNAQVNNAKILAVADGSRVRFPGAPVTFGTRKVNGTAMDNNGMPLPVPGIAGLHVHATDA